MKARSKISRPPEWQEPKAPARKTVHGVVSKKRPMWVDPDAPEAEPLTPRERGLLAMQALIEQPKPKPPYTPHITVPQARDLAGLSNAQLTAALANADTGGPGGTRVMGRLNAQRIDQEIAWRKANGLWSLPS